MEAGVHVGFYTLPRLDEKTAVHVVEELKRIKEELDYREIYLLTWYLDLDGSRLAIIVAASQPLKILKTVERRLISRLHGSGIEVNRILVSRVEQVGATGRELRGLMASRIFYRFLEKVVKEDDLKSNLPRRLRENLETIIDAHETIINMLPEYSFPLLAYLHKRKGVPIYEVVEKAYFFTGNKTDLQQLVNTLIQGGICVLKDDKLYLNEDAEHLVSKLELFIRRFLNYILTSPLEHVDLEAFKVKKPKIVVLRSGEVSEYSPFKVLESLFAAKVPLEVGLKIVSAIPLFIEEDVVSSLELASLVESLLAGIDPSGIYSSSYEYVLTTRERLMVEFDGSLYPFSRSYIRSRINRLVDEMPLKPAPSLIEASLETVYEVFRRLYMTAAPRLLLEKEEYIKLRPEDIDSILKTVILSSSPVGEILVKCGWNAEEILKVYGKRINEVELFLRKVKDNLRRGGYVDPDAVLEKAFYLINLVLLVFNVLPGPSINANASYLALKVREAKRGKLRILLDLESKTLNRIHFFARKVQSLTATSNPLLDPQLVSLMANIASDLKNTMENK